MKIEQLKVLETETVGDVESIKAAINIDSMPFMFEMLSKSLYSNPIGSIVREITSNCFDSHKEAGIEDPVIIKRVYDAEDNQYYISFIDVGVGLSPERIKNVYMNYFSSTKRDSNEQIGGFGLGSKTPLSYQDMFYINTIFNGIEYNYILSKGESSPTLDLIGESETDARSGTEIKIAIKSDSPVRDDRYRFEEEIRQQLCYFDNVFVQNFTIDNHYKIFEGEYFKYRNKYQYSHSMHIALGKVSYPIDWKAIGIEIIDIPVAVKFEIGELVVTPNRENLRYTDEVKALVKARIELCMAELLDKYSNQNPEIDDLFKFLDLKNTKPSIRFDDDTKLFLPARYGAKNSIAFTPLKHLPIAIPDDPFFMYGTYLEISSNKGRPYSGAALNKIKSGIQRSYLFYSKHKTSNEIRNAFLGAGWIISDVKIDYHDICHLLGLYYYIDPRIAYRNNGEKYDYIKLDDNRRVRKVPILGKAKIIKEYMDYFRKFVEDNSRDYQKIEVPEQFIKDYREARKAESTAYIRKLEGKVLIRNHNGYKDEVSLLSLSKVNILIYGHNDDADHRKISKLKEFLDIKFYSRSTKQTFIKYVKLSKEVFKKVAKLDNAIYVDNIWDSPKIQRNIRDYYTCDLINSNVLRVQDNNLMRRIRPDIVKLSRELDYFYDKNAKYGVSLRETILEVGKRKNLVNLKVLALANQITKYITGLEVIEYLKSDIPNDMLLQILKPYKKRLDWRMYVKKTPPTEVEPTSDPEPETDITSAGVCIGNITYRTTATTLHPVFLAQQRRIDEEFDQMHPTTIPEPEIDMDTVDAAARDLLPDIDLSVVEDIVFPSEEDNLDFLTLI